MGEIINLFDSAEPQKPVRELISLGPELLEKVTPSEGGYYECPDGDRLVRATEFDKVPKLISSETTSDHKQREKQSKARVFVLRAFMRDSLLSLDETRAVKSTYHSLEQLRARTKALDIEDGGIYALSALRAAIEDRTRQRLQSQAAQLTSTIRFLRPAIWLLASTDTTFTTMDFYAGRLAGVTVVADQLKPVLAIKGAVFGTLADELSPVTLPLYLRTTRSNK